jgi:DNA-binding PadR family transcriptional regulator
MTATHAMHGPWPGGRCGPLDPWAAWMAMAAGREHRGRHGHGHGRGGENVFWGGGPPFGRGFGPWGRGGPKARRGDVRAALLVLLEEEPRNGYQLMQEIEQRSQGVWRPSPGSVYPALQQLEDEGLVRAEEREGRKAFVLTDAGRAHVQEHRDELAAPWEAMSGAMPEGVMDVRGLIGQLAAAAMQATRAGDETQAAQVREILAEARRSIYRILAEE